MNVGERYEDITKGFNSIRDDAKGMVDQLADDKLDLMERVSNVWMKVSRGDIATRFNKIRDIYLDVTKDTKDQIDREHTILEAYRDFRGALKQSEVMALEVLDVAPKPARRARRQRCRPRPTRWPPLPDGSRPIGPGSKWTATRNCATCRTRKAATRSPRTSRTTSPSPTITSEVVMARLMQTTNAKERVYQQSISFFSTNETVLTALSGLVHRHVRPA